MSERMGQCRKCKLTRKLNNLNLCYDCDNSNALARFKQTQAAREAAYLKKYGMSSIQKVIILDKQGGKCAVCGTNNTKIWHLDHCHECGGPIIEPHNYFSIRGVLCETCNPEMGLIERSFRKGTLLSLTGPIADYLCAHKCTKSYKF